jgi:RNA polymerase sigma factor (sigma-70 family)
LEANFFHVFVTREAVGILILGKHGESPLIEPYHKEELFDQIVTENRSRFMFISRSYAAGNDAMDLFQEIMKQLWKSLDAFEGKSSPNTWAYRVAVNTAITFRRNHSRRLRFWKHYGETTVRENADSYGRDEHAILEEFVRSLNPADRDIFTLYLTNLDYGEIAEITGVAEATLRMRISRIKSKYQARYLGN